MLLGGGGAGTEGGADCRCDGDCDD
jgi:hypothetical protein